MEAKGRWDDFEQLSLLQRLLSDFLSVGVDDFHLPRYAPTSPKPSPPAKQTESLPLLKHTVPVGYARQRENTA